MYHVSLRSVLAAIAALTLCQDFRALCSTLPNHERGFRAEFPLMSRGFGADYGDFPWMASVVQQQGNSFRQCGGTVIGHLWVLTAAHCIDLPWTTSIISFGEIDISRGVSGQSDAGLTIETDVAIIHPDWDPVYKTNDIGLLYTITEIPFNEFIQPIDLAGFHTQSRSYEYREALAIGWGREENRGPSRFLKFGKQHIMSNSECGRPYSQLCTSGQSSVIVCQGDSGGPLVITENNRFVQIGIVSAGLTTRCGANLPQFYTRITAYIDWILAVVEQGAYE